MRSFAGAIFMIGALLSSCNARSGIPGTNLGGDGGTGDAGSLDGRPNDGLRSDAAGDVSSGDATMSSDGGATDAFARDARDGAPSDRVCTPGAATCEGGVASVCRPDGRSFQTYECDPLQGMTCTPTGCRGVCSPAELGASYIGCDYYPTVTLNPVYPEFHFAVGVANTSADPADVVITRDGATIATRTVAANGFEIFELPWVDELKGAPFAPSNAIPPPASSMVVRRGAYRLRSNRPVTAYQYSALEYAIAPTMPMACPRGSAGLPPSMCASYSNDASLLFPVNTLTNEYVVASWPSTTAAGFIAITATRDGTEVTIDPPSGAAIRAGGGIDSRGDGTVHLDAGDVLQVVAETNPYIPEEGPPPSFRTDLTGTRVRSTAPVHVIGGHTCANVPRADTGYCDHIEETALPLTALGTEHAATRPSPAEPGAGSLYTIRVLGVVFPTVVTFDPPVGTTETVMLTTDRPVFEAIGVDYDVIVRGDHPIAVAEYLQGATSEGGFGAPPLSGDPDIAVVPPYRQFRTRYVFFASPTYNTNWVNIVAPLTASVSLDGRTITGADMTRIGGSTYGVARIAIAGGAHDAQSSSPFGVFVYGYGVHTSYAYPGGLDLTQQAF